MGKKRSCCGKKQMGEKERLIRNAHRSFVMGNTKLQTVSMEGLTYRPKTNQTKLTYEAILHLVQTILTDTPHDILRSAADEIICILKQDNLKNVDKKQQLSQIKVLIVE